MTDTGDTGDRENPDGPDSAAPTPPEGNARRIDLLKMLREAAVSEEMHDMSRALGVLRGRMTEVELQAAQKNTGAQRIAIVVHSLRRVIDDEAAALNGLTGPLHDIVVELKTVVDASDEVLREMGL